MMKVDEKIDKAFYIAGWICALAGVILLLGVDEWPTIIGKIYHGCKFHSITGLYCPGCGGTRAVFSLLRGEIVRSFLFHPFVLYSVVMGCLFMITQTIQKISRGRLKIGMHFRPVYIYIALIIIALNFIVKNMLLIVWKIPVLG